LKGCPIQTITDHEFQGFVFQAIGDDEASKPHNEEESRVDKIPYQLRIAWQNPFSIESPPSGEIMILDRLEHAHLYRPLGVEIARALDYLRQTDLCKLADGRYELDGDRLFALVQRYRPKAASEALWEAHRRYVDVQYVAAGRERMGYTLLRSDLAVSRPYDPERDIIFYDTDGDLVEVPEGSFAVFMPHDIHAPGLTLEPPETVKEVCKVVVKCRVAD
jgi:biofilm protein TabA